MQDARNEGKAGAVIFSPSLSLFKTIQILHIWSIVKMHPKNEDKSHHFLQISAIFYKFHVVWGEKWEWKFFIDKLECRHRQIFMTDFTAAERKKLISPGEKWNYYVLDVMMCVVDETRVPFQFQQLTILFSIRIQ